MVKFFPAQIGDSSVSLTETQFSRRPSNLRNESVKGWGFLIWF